MTMDANDLDLYKSVYSNDGASNGGRRGYTEVVTSVLENLFPIVSDEERTAGVTRYRKLFFVNANAADEPGTNARFMIKAISTGEDRIVLFVGTQRDVQGDILGTEKLYASGELNAQANAGATQVVVNFENVADVDIADGDMLWLFGTNGSMFNEVSGTPGWVGNQATIDLVTVLNVDYPTNSVCAMVIECGTLEPTYADWVEDSAGDGTFDEATNLLLGNLGTVDDDWTLTFSSATAFSVSGVYEGSVGSGTTGGDFAPINPNTGQPYFTIEAAGWAGTWAASDTIGWKTHPASYPIWAKEVVPPGAAVESQNETTVRMYVG